jgi:hypothetical protein
LRWKLTSSTLPGIPISSSPSSKIQARLDYHDFVHDTHGQHFQSSRGDRQIRQNQRDTFLLSLCLRGLEAAALTRSAGPGHPDACSERASLEIYGAAQPSRRSLTHQIFKSAKEISRSKPGDSAFQIICRAHRERQSNPRLRRYKVSPWEFQYAFGAKQISQLVQVFKLAAEHLVFDVALILWRLRPWSCGF